MKQRISDLLTFLNAGVYEKETEIKMALLAALAGENVILLGPPGIAKSMVARRLATAFGGAHSFEYLMSRFSTPDEIFGPVSIARLKENDKYERAIDGYLPTADVVFLDEIWKAGPAIQNTLLTVINEKIFRNGDKEIKLPLKLLIAASNELPAQGEGLEALWDRFIIRVVSKNIESEGEFCRMITDKNNAQPKLNLYQIQPAEYSKWQSQIDSIEVPQKVLNAICLLRQNLHNVKINEEGEKHDVYVSDRRWKKIVHILRTTAFMHGRKEVSLSDLLVCTNCFWQESEEIPFIRYLVLETILHDIEVDFKNLKNDVSAQLRHSMVKNALHRLWEYEFSPFPKRRDPLKALDYRIKLYDGFYCHIANHGIGKTYFYFADFISLSRNPSNPSKMLFYSDDEDPQKTLVRFYAEGDKEAKNDIMIRHVYRVRDLENFDVLYIDGVEYKVDLLAEGEKHKLPQVGDRVTSRDLNTETLILKKALDDRIVDITSNIFVTKEDLVTLEELRKDISNRMTNTEFETQKLVITDGVPGKVGND